MASNSPEKTFDYSSTDGTTIVAYRWNTNERPRAVLQLTHGMGEHALRYGEFARALNAEGIVVYGQDQRGHGATAKSTVDFGRLGTGGWQLLVNDIHLLVKITRSENLDIPLILLGHSMGSFAVQQYLLDHSAEIDAAILTGTVAMDLLELTSNLDQPFKLSALNTAFEPARTNFDWLSRDETVVDAYIKDPLCGFGLDIESMKEMHVGGRRMTVTQALQQIRRDLPICISVGELDPINNRLAWLGVLTERFRAAGLTEVIVKSYPEARHEVLNETNRSDVIKDILNWLESTVLASALSTKTASEKR